VAPDRRWVALALAVLVAACGGDSNEKEDAEAAARFAAARARTDSIRTARRAADSVAQVAWTACADSVTSALQKTAAGRRQLKAAQPDGGVPADVTGACGVPKTLAAAPAATPAAGAPAAVTPATDAPAPTPAQVELARADSARRQQAAAAEAPAPQATTLAATPVPAEQAPTARSDSDVLRETFAYGGGARDPFVSVINSKNAGPELVDLQLVGVYQDVRSNANSVAILREKQSGKRFKVRTGDQIGRLRVAQIRPKDVVFTIEDFGFERQETLSLRKQEDVTP
jgi:hypothetical protein